MINDLISVMDLNIMKKDFIIIVFGLIKHSIFFAGLLNGRYSFKRYKAVLSLGLIIILCLIEGTSGGNRQIQYILLFLPLALSFWFSEKYGKREIYLNLLSCLIVNITSIIERYGISFLLNVGLIEDDNMIWLIISREIYELIILIFIILIGRKISRRNKNRAKDELYWSDIISMIIISINSVFLAGGAFCLFTGIYINHNIFGISMLISCFTLTAMCCFQNILHRKVNYYRELERKNEELEDMRTKYYKSLENENQRMHKLKHEYLRHMMAVRELCSAGDTEVCKYVDTWRNDVLSTGKTIDCGNRIVSILVMAAYERASLKNIDFKWEGRVPENKSLSQNELCEIIGNVLDNAIDECERITEKSYSCIKFMMNRDMLLISSENTCRKEDIPCNKIIPSSKKGKHGYGMENIKTIVKKHDGNMEWWAEDHIFHIKIVIKL